MFLRLLNLSLVILYMHPMYLDYTDPFSTAHPMSLSHLYVFCFVCNSVGPVYATSLYQFIRTLVWGHSLKHRQPTKGHIHKENRLCFGSHQLPIVFQLAMDGIPSSICAGVFTGLILHRQAQQLWIHTCRVHSLSRRQHFTALAPFSSFPSLCPSFMVFPALPGRMGGIGIAVPPRAERSSHRVTSYSQNLALGLEMHHCTDCCPL